MDACGSHQLIRPANEGETECCICMHNVANATILPCQHAEFCYPCIFKMKGESKGCPICRAAIEQVDIHEDCPLNELAQIMTEDDWRAAALQEMETLGDYADCYDFSTMGLLEFLFARWLQDN